MLTKLPSYEDIRAKQDEAWKANRDREEWEEAIRILAPLARSYDRKADRLRRDVAKSDADYETHRWRIALEAQRAAGIAKAHDHAIQEARRLTGLLLVIQAEIHEMQKAIQGAA